MYTSVTVLAFACSLSLTGANLPVFHQDYSQALLAGQTFGRPLAIFVGADSASALQEGAMRDDVRKILTEQYVSVVLDPVKDRKLVELLAITKNTGVVISDRGGSLQAFHHDGKIAQVELAKQLWRFADPAVVIRVTQSNAPAPRISYYSPVYSQPVSRPVMTQSC